MALPQFAAGDYYKIQIAVDAGVLRYPSWVYVRDKSTMAFIDQDLSINLIESGNSQSVVNVTELPNVSEASKNVLYIYDGNVYAFNGSDFVLMYKDFTEEILQIRAEIESLTNRVSILEEVSHSPIQWVEL